MRAGVRTALTILGVAVFAGLLWYGARQETQVECEICVTFRGRTVCRVGRGVDEAAARQSASTAACAVLGSGVTDAMQCGATPPSSARCQQLGSRNDPPETLRGEGRLGPNRDAV